MSKIIFPHADHVTQWFEGVYPGSVMDTNCMCLHTTETTGWSDYAGGSEAPNMTGNPLIKQQKTAWRQHFPANHSARGLVNAAGGVETNTLNVFQIELIGTCDPQHEKTWDGLKAGVDYIYWPDAPDWALRDLAEVVKWLHRNYPKFNVRDGAPRGWLAYPKSYGSVNGQRMTDKEWENCYGIFGHQHVPENDHGDPGNFPIEKLIEFSTNKPAPKPTPVPAPKPSKDTRITQARDHFDNALAELHKGNRLLIEAEKHGRTGAVRDGRKALQIDHTNIQHTLSHVLPKR